MLGNLQRAADLVHSFKQVAADQTSEDRHTFNLRGCLADIILTLGPVWRKPGHKVDLICPGTLEVDSYPGAISQLIANFITNSAAHGFVSGQKGIITISANFIDNETVEIIYSDNGKGISADLHRKVFEPFYTTRRDRGNTGLGLHIVYNLVVNRLGGTIDLVSAEGAGTRFIIRFQRSLSGQDRTQTRQAQGMLS